jgi:hypothetical protein
MEEQILGYFMIDGLAKSEEILIEIVVARDFNLGSSNFKENANKVERIILSRNF